MKHMLVDVDGRLKCAAELLIALFDVDGAMLIEKYCETSAKEEAK